MNKQFIFPSVTLCIPTLNPGELAKVMVGALKLQTFKPDEILVIDSASTDDSISTYAEIGAKIITIHRNDFDHGGTRNLVFKKSQADVYVFLTQDAIPSDTCAIENLVRSLSESANCALVYGRQAPSPKAGVFARHARLFNYPVGEGVVLKSKEDIPMLGIKAAFCSNSFSAYRREAMAQINYFSENTLFAEDSIAAAKLLQGGWSIGYVPQAVVTHSHDYSLMQDFCRYFDVGAFHCMNRWYIDLLGKAEGEGKRFVRSEYAYLKQEGTTFPLVRLIFRNGVRWFGYKVGRLHNHLPLVLCSRLSTNKTFWKRAVTK